MSKRKYANKKKVNSYYNRPLAKLAEVLGIIRQEKENASQERKERFQYAQYRMFIESFLNPNEWYLVDAANSLHQLEIERENSIYKWYMEFRKFVINGYTNDYDEFTAHYSRELYQIALRRDFNNPAFQNRFRQWKNHLYKMAS